MNDRNQQSQEVANVEPSWLANTELIEDANHDVQEYMKMPRLQLTQGQTKDRALVKEHGHNAAVVMPGSIKIADEDTSFRFVVQYFYPQWIAWNDQNDTTSPDIHDSTTNKEHPVAIRAKDPNNWEETYGDGFKRRYSEHLNFVCSIYDPESPLHGTQFVMAFSRSEHKTGMSLNTALANRRSGGKKVNYFFQIHEGIVVEKSNDKGVWPGLSFRNPTTGDAFIRQEDAEEMKSQFYLFKEANQNSTLVVENQERGDQTPSNPYDSGPPASDDDVPF